MLPVPTLSVTPSDTQHGDAPLCGTPNALPGAGGGQGPAPRPCCPQAGGCSGLLTSSDSCSPLCHKEGKSTSLSHQRS